MKSVFTLIKRLFKPEVAATKKEEIATFEVKRRQKAEVVSPAVPGMKPKVDRYTVARSVARGLEDSDQRRDLAMRNALHDLNSKKRSSTSKR